MTDWLSYCTQCWRPTFIEAVNLIYSANVIEILVCTNAMYNCFYHDEPCTTVSGTHSTDLARMFLTFLCRERPGHSIALSGRV